MIRFALKLALAVLVANAVWQLGSAYATFYRFQDAITEIARFSARQNVEGLKQRVLETATEFDLPMTDDDFEVRRENEHTFINGSYTQAIDLVPGYPYQWSFTVNVDTFTNDAPAPVRRR